MVAFLVCREPGILLKVRECSDRRHGGLQFQETSFAHVGLGFPDRGDVSVQLTQENFTKSLKPMPMTLALRAPRQRPLPLDEIKVWKCKLGELRQLLTVSRPEIRDHLARVAACAISLRGSDIYRINDPVKPVKEGQQETVL